MFKKIAEFDNRVSVYWTNRHFSEKTTKFLKFYVRLGDGYIWALFALCLFLYLGWNAFWPILAQAVVAIVVALREPLRARKSARRRGRHGDGRYEGFVHCRTLYQKNAIKCRGK